VSIEAYDSLPELKDSGNPRLGFLAFGQVDEGSLDGLLAIPDQTPQYDVKRNEGV